MNKETLVIVEIQAKGGWYIAQSSDLEGLVVCHEDCDKVMTEIPECIKILYKVNHNMEVDVVMQSLIYKELPTRQNYINYEIRKVSAHKDSAIKSKSISICDM